MAPQISTKALAMGGIVYIGMSTATYLYVKGTKPPSCPCENHGKEDGNAFDRIAGEYDQKINLDEKLMGITLLRRYLLRKAEGDVLEVSAGTGRNLPYYSSPAVKSLTLTDTSREMLLRAHEKQTAAAEKGKSGVPKISFCLADVEKLCSENANNDVLADSEQQGDEETRFGPALRSMRQLHRGRYDTVVDTFGLCSCEDPVKALKEMAKAVRPGGRLLLLEHGRSSTWDWINKILDNNADAHLKKWGCQWNRDIHGAVKEAGLVVESMSRWHFGTTYVIIARPGAGKYE